MELEIDIDATARKMAAEIIGLPGWDDALEECCAGVQAGLPDVIESMADLAPSLDVGGICKAVVDRVEAILRDIATAEPAGVLERYEDLLPADMRTGLLRKAVKALQALGVTVEVLKDDAGSSFLALGNLDAAGPIPTAVLRAAAATALPVGSLHSLN